MPRSKRQIAALQKATQAAQLARASTTYSQLNAPEFAITSLHTKYTSICALDDPVLAFNLPLPGPSRRTTRSCARAASNAFTLSSALQSTLRCTQKRLADALRKNQILRNTNRQLKTKLEDQTRQYDTQLSSLLEKLNLERESSSIAIHRSNVSRKLLERCRGRLKQSQRLASRLKDTRVSLRSAVKGLKTSLDRESCSAQNELDKRLKEIASTGSQVSDLKKQLVTADSRNEDLTQQLAVSIERAEYMRSHLGSIHSRFEEANSEISRLTLLVNNMEKSSIENDFRVSNLQLKLKNAKEKNKGYEGRLRAAQMTAARARERANSLTKTLSLATDFKIYEKGIVSREARALFRAMSAAGCSQKRIGTLTKNVLQIFAPSSRAANQKTVSARTVGRANGEGGIAAEIQLGYELMHAESFTVSGDATTHKNENIESQHINLSVEDYSSSYDSEVNPPETKAVRFAGIHSSVNHKSETQFEGFLHMLENIISMFNSGPLLDEFDLDLQISTLARKLRGMHSDHAEDQKKLARLILQWKLAVSHESLGHEALKKLSKLELMDILDSAQRDRISEIGGTEVWDSLCDEDQGRIVSNVYAAVTRSLGEDAYSQLSDAEKKNFDYFVWAGCCMHKELNAVKGGVEGMCSYWVESGEKGPALMPNRDNAIVLGDREEDDLDTPEQERAFQVTGRGAVKVLALLGMYLNNSDSKKGQHKQYTAYFLDKYGRGTVYPDTCNTRYHCYVDAAAETITHLDGYIEYLCHTRDHKEKGNFNHMEENIYNGLLDDPTRTEMVALLLYGEAVTYPYARSVRGPGTEKINVLDLGPVHEKLARHIQTLIEDPALVLAPDAEPGKAIFNPADLPPSDLKWMHPDAMLAARGLFLCLPHVEGVFVSFLKRALVTWRRFSAEFNSDGVIALSSSSQKDAAWMPSTNDANEGALGLYRIDSRRFPVESMHMYNAREMHKRNNTRGFMLKKLNKPRHDRYIRKKWRERDSNGLEKKRKRILVTSRKAAAEIKKRKRAAQAEKRAAISIQLQAVSQHLVLEESDIRKMKAAEILLQLRYLRSLNEDDEIPKAKDIKNKKDSMPALIIAMQRWHARHPEARTSLPTTPLHALAYDTLEFTGFDADSDQNDCERLNEHSVTVAPAACSTSDLTPP